MEKSWTRADTGLTDGMGKATSTKTKAPPEPRSDVVRPDPTRPDPTREQSGLVFQAERMTLMSVCHWPHVNLHSGGARWSPRDSSHKAEPASGPTDEQALSKNDVGF